MWFHRDTSVARVTRDAERRVRFQRDARVLWPGGKRQPRRAVSRFKPGYYHDRVNVPRSDVVTAYSDFADDADRVGSLWYAYISKVETSTDEIDVFILVQWEKYPCYKQIIDIHKKKKNIIVIVPSA